VRDNKKNEKKKKQSRSAAGVTVWCALFEALLKIVSDETHDIGGYPNSACVRAAIMTITKNAISAATPPDQIIPSFGLKN
jgi:hypothetical protein